MIHNGGGYADLSWSPPNVPVDTAGVTYDVQRRQGTRSWRSLPSVDGAVATRRISFADLPPVGVQSRQTFRVRAVHNGRRSAWVESDGNLTTWNKPQAARVTLNRHNYPRSSVDLRFIFTVADAKHRRNLRFKCEVSVGNRSYSSTLPMGRTCVEHYGDVPVQRVTVGWDHLVVGETTWVRITPRRGTVIGVPYEIDVTRSAADSTKLISQNEWTPEDIPDPPKPTGCGFKNERCEAPNAPDAVATWGSGSVTVSFNINHPNYNPGTNPNGSPARITRVEMKYRACPYAWRGNGWVKVGEHGGEENDSCRHGTRNRNRSSGSITFRGSFSADIDMWNTKVEGRVRNSRGRYSTWAGGGGHVTP